MRFKITERDRAALLRRAPEFEAATKEIVLTEFECQGDLFRSLVWSVISQQLSGRVAEVITERVESLLGEVTPEALGGADAGELRSCGLSVRKIEYLKGAAEAALSGEVDFGALGGLGDEELVAVLTKLRGIGVWTAEMLLIFALGRKDVLSFGDLGIRRGMMRLYGLEEIEAEAFEEYRKRYSPYGTLASLYLWRIGDTAKK